MGSLKPQILALEFIALEPKDDLLSLTCRVLLSEIRAGNICQCFLCGFFRPGTRAGDFTVVLRTILQSNYNSHVIICYPGMIPQSTCYKSRVKK